VINLGGWFDAKGEIENNLSINSEKGRLINVNFFGKR